MLLELIGVKSFHLDQKVGGEDHEKADSGHADDE